MHQNFEISLLNPFSRKRLRLPPMTSFPKLGEAQFELIHEFYVRAAAVSSENINSTPEDITVMVSEGGFRRLAFAKPGDSSWCLIEDDPGIHYTGIMFYKGQFYAIGQEGLVVCDVGPNPKAISIAAVPQMNWTLSHGGRYLVELVGELVLVERWLNTRADDFDGQDNGAGDDEDEVGFDVEDLGTKHDVDRKSWYRTISFSVYKMNFASHEWVPLKDLSNHVIFVGRNTAFSMPVWSSQGQECKGNCIYFTDDYDIALTPYCREDGLFYGYDMGVFDVKNGIIKPRNGKGKKLFPPPMWVNYLPW